MVIGKPRCRTAVAIARRRDRREFERMTTTRAVWDRVLYATIRYGYESWRAVLPLAAVFVVAIGVFTWLCTALGWLLATLTLAGVTGVIQGEQST